MAKKSYEVRAIWDDENKLWYCESDLIGLHIEAGTFAEFRELMHTFAADLIVTNHYSDEDLGGDPRDLIPAIVISRAEGPARRG